MDNYLALLGFVVCFAVVLIVVRVVRKNKVSNYDERQLLVRGNAYRNAFVSMVMYGLLYSVYIIMSEKELMQDGVSMYIGVLVGVTVFTVYCIWNDAYLRLSQNPKKYFILGIVVVMLNAIGGFEKLREGKVIKDGILTFNCLQISLAIAWLIIEIALIIKLVFEKRVEE